MATSTKEVPPKASASASASDSSRPGTTGGIKYEYMFQANKSPTQQLDAILRAIARHVACEIGDMNDKKLTPTKLAAFYKAVGGDYDCMSFPSKYPNHVLTLPSSLRTDGPPVYLVDLASHRLPA